jgi:hypothetical protein
MSLAEGKEMFELNETDFADTDAAVEKWQQCPASSLLHHGGRCCRVAREWVLSMDYSQLDGTNLLSGPRWLRQRYTWGPSVWPLFWCDAVERKTLDCGALAALANEVFAARGVRSYTAQLIQQYSDEATLHWRKQWAGGGASTHWIEGDLIYHEGNAVVVREGEIRVWDASAGWWVNPRQFGGYGGLLALRVCDPHGEAPAHFSWGAHRVAPNRWQKVERARPALSFDHSLSAGA